MLMNLRLAKEALGEQVRKGVPALECVQQLTAQLVTWAMRLGAHCDGSERPRYAANTAALHKKTHTYNARRIDDQLRSSRTWAAIVGYTGA